MKEQNGITLIALIIAIILMLILAGVVISLTIGENGLIDKAKYAVQKSNEETAREKLELALADLTSHKYTNEAYNENTYINSYLENEKMKVVEDVVTVDGWRFKIDRSVPQIGESLGQEEIKVTKIVKEYLGKNENGKYIAQITVIIESSKEIKSVVFQEDNGTKLEIIPTEEKTKIAKDMIIELDKEYKIIVNKTDGKSEEKTIIEKLPDLGILISTPYVGTSSFTTKVQYVTNEEDVESYTYMLNEEEITTNANGEYTLEDTLEPETTYNVKVIAKYKNGLTVESNVVTIKTEKRTYLYNKGNECTDITGGWTGFIYEYKYPNGSSYGKEGAYFTKSSDSCLEFGKNGTGYGDGGYKTVNQINTRGYTKLCASVKSFSCNFIPRSDYPQAYNGYHIYIGNNIISKICKKDTDLSSEIVRTSLNSNEINDNVFMHTSAGAWVTSGKGRATCKIDAIWLEK